MQNRLIIWVDTKKAEDENINLDYLRDCVVAAIEHFEEGKTAIGLPIKLKDILSFEVIEKTDADIEVEWRENNDAKN